MLIYAAILSAGVLIGILIEKMSYIFLYKTREKVKEIVKVKREKREKEENDTKRPAIYMSEKRDRQIEKLLEDE